MRLPQTKNNAQNVKIQLASEQGKQTDIYGNIKKGKSTTSHNENPVLSPKNGARSALSNNSRDS